MRAIKGTVLVRPIEQKKETASGLILAAAPSEMQKGTIISSGVEGITSGDDVYYKLGTTVNGLVMLRELEIFAIE